MAEEEHHEIVIIKRHGGHEEGHHGGAWKIAFADFMTALMALFLVMWLIASMSEKSKSSVSRYFNPVKLVEMTPLKKGIQDAKDAQADAGPADKADLTVPETKKAQAAAAEKQPASPDKKDADPAAKAAQREVALFRDPYAVLAEIALKGDGERPKSPQSGPGASVSASNVDAASAQDGSDVFQDPFATLPRAPRTATPPDKIRDPDFKITPPAAAPSQPAASAPPPAAQSRDAAAPMPAKAESKPALVAAQAAQAAREAQANAAEAAKLQGEIDATLAKEGPSQAMPAIEVKSTEEGLLVSMTDASNFAMFAVGSAEPQAKTIRAMEKIAQLLKGRPGAVIVRGYTDGRPYKSAVYDNWRLSTARAHMAHYMLVRGGLDDKRFDRVEGLADRNLKVPADPSDPQNRRIEILLRKEKP